MVTWYAICKVISDWWLQLAGGGYHGNGRYIAGAGGLLHTST